MEVIRDAKDREIPAWKPWERKVLTDYFRKSCNEASIALETLKPRGDTARWTTHRQGNPCKTEKHVAGINHVCKYFGIRHDATAFGVFPAGFQHSFVLVFPIWAILFPFAKVMYILHQCMLDTCKLHFDFYKGLHLSGCLESWKRLTFQIVLILWKTLRTI